MTTFDDDKRSTLTKASSSTIMIIILLMICLINNVQQQANGMVMSLDIDEEIYIPNCYDGELHTTIGPDCRILELYNQTYVDELALENSTKLEELSNKCSCRLTQMEQLWEESYNKQDIKTLSSMVDGIIEERLIEQRQQEAEKRLSSKDRNKNKSRLVGEEFFMLSENNYPEYLWSDLDFFYGISFHTAAKDFFIKRKIKSQKHQISSSLKEFLKSDTTWSLITTACKRIAKDTNKVFRYLENLARLSPLGFISVIKEASFIEMTYQASKACKFLVLKNMKQYRLKPINSLLIPVVYDDALENRNVHSNISLDIMLIHEQQQREEQAEESEEQQDNNNNNNDPSFTSNPWFFGNGENKVNNPLDSEEEFELNWNNKTIDENLGLKGGSVYLLNCGHWQRKKFSMKELESECPMMMIENGQNIPSSWLKNHTTILNRSIMAIKCACQLLLHNKTWEQVLKDKNVQVMATALTNYLNENRMPDFTTTPLKAINGWFERAMDRFKNNRKLSIKEIIKTKFNDEDPTIFMKKGISEDALELLRRGCNYIMFNYNKGSPDARNELKLIRYLDNLQLISPDKLFTFDLTLQDPNLFKLNALSKMCKPIVY